MVEHPIDMKVSSIHVNRLVSMVSQSTFWRHSRPDWMGPQAAWAGGGSPAHGRGWGSFKVSSNLSHSKHTASLQLTHNCKQLPIPVQMPFSLGSPQRSCWRCSAPVHRKQKKTKIKLLYHICSSQRAVLKTAPQFNSEFLNTWRALLKYTDRSPNVLGNFTHLTDNIRQKLKTVINWKSNLSNLQVIFVRQNEQCGRKKKQRKIFWFAVAIHIDIFCSILNYEFSFLLGEKWQKKLKSEYSARTA